MSSIRHIFLFLMLAAALLTLTQCSSETIRGSARVQPSLEDRKPDGSPYTPSTQSFLRERHWLESVSEVEIRTDGDDMATIEFKSPDADNYLRVHNLPLHQLVPRLHYHNAEPPDDFDALNLLLAEFSRNSLSVPVGKDGDAMAHFQTSLPEDVPWILKANYRFEPNKFVRPNRVSVINNCLKPGLWELNASDRSGEIYHAWFTMPDDLYLELAAAANGISKDFVAEALHWHTKEVRLELDRLRQARKETWRTTLSLCQDGVSGFSTQDSRRKLHKGYVHVPDGNGGWRIPQRLSELTQTACRMSNFIEPGKYSLTDRKEFDLSFLRRPRAAEVQRVQPLTSYNWRKAPAGDRQGDYLELRLHLEEFDIIVGNLPMFLLVDQADFAINGFGVGILSSGGFAERRNYLVDDGPAPSFAYLCRERDGAYYGINSHDYGIEQIFIRTHIKDDVPWWELTITSYERIVDLVKYRIDIPSELHEELKNYSLEYIAPLYLTYRDDNLR